MRPEKKERMLILGAGAAGLSAADAIRSVNPDSPVTIVSGEKGLPYARMALPYYISGKIPVKGIFTGMRRDFSGRKIEYIPGDPAVGLDTHRQKVLLRSGLALEYGKLLVATGSVPEYPDMLAGLDAPGICNLWTLKDALQIKRRIEHGGAIAIWGAGFVAFMAAKALAMHGRKVYLICRANRILRRVLDEGAAGLMEHALSEKGVVCLKDTNVEHIGVLKGGKKHIVLDGGRELAVDVLIVALGTRPNTGFLHETPLAGKKGMEVDEYMGTRIPGIYAAGDLALVRDCVTGERIAHALWSTAVREGRGAGLNMAGDRHQCDLSLLMNVIDLGGYGAVSVGHPLLANNTEVYQFADKAGKAYRRLVFQDRRLIGAIIVGRCTDTGFFPALIRGVPELTQARKQKILRFPWNIAPALLGL